MAYMHYIEPNTMVAVLEEADMIAFSFSDGQPIVCPVSISEPEEGLFLYE